MQSRKRKWAMALWHGMPVVSGLALVILPLMLGGYGARMSTVLPHFALLAVAFWSIEHPRRFSWQAAVMLGLLADVILHHPPGLTALIFLSFRGLILMGRREVVQQGFVPAWLLVAISYLVVALVEWVVLVVYQGHVLPLKAPLLQWTVAVLLYPLAHWVFTLLEQRFRRRYWFFIRTM